MKYLLFVFCLFVFAFVAKADHYLGANISYKSLGNMKYEVTITAYQDEQHKASDKDAITVYWGDNTSSSVLRTNGGGAGVLINSDIRKSVFVGTHQYSNDGNYRIFVSESYRRASILNVANGQSAISKLYVDAIVPVYSDPNICVNNSVQYQLDPIFYAYQNLEYSVNPGAYDSDGDSLVFSLINCRDKNGASAKNYFVPLNATIDADNGSLVWPNPQVGTFAFCVLVEEFRNGQKIAQSSSDFVVTTGNSFSTAPVATYASDVYLYGGDTVKYPFDLTMSGISSHSYNFWGGGLLAPVSNHTGTSTHVIDTITWITLNSDEKSGPYAFVHRFQVVQAGHIFIKDFTVGVHVLGNQSWTCTVPDLSEIVDVAPELFDFSVSPTIFDEYVWLNVGDKSGATVYLYDIQGKLLEKYTNFTQKTVQLDLSNLASAIYILVLYDNNERILTQRLVKK